MRTASSVAIILLLVAISRVLRGEGPHATRPSAPPKRTVVIKANIDGSDELYVTARGLIWNHKLWDWPSDVTINGRSWDPHDPMPLEQLGINLTAVDLSAERVTVTHREARDTLAVEANDDGLVVYFCDSPGGADAYSVTLEFAPEPPPKSKATTRP